MAHLEFNPPRRNEIPRLARSAARGDIAAANRLVVLLLSRLPANVPNDPYAYASWEVDILARKFAIWLAINGVGTSLPDIVEYMGSSRTIQELINLTKHPRATPDKAYNDYMDLRRVLPDQAKGRRCGRCISHLARWAEERRVDYAEALAPHCGTEPSCQCCRNQNCRKRDIASVAYQKAASDRTETQRLPLSDKRKAVSFEPQAATGSLPAARRLAELAELSALRRATNEDFRRETESALMRTMRRAGVDERDALFLLLEASLDWCDSHGVADPQTECIAAPHNVALRRRGWCDVCIEECDEWNHNSRRVEGADQGCPCCKRGVKAIRLDEQRRRQGWCRRCLERCVRSKDHYRLTRAARGCPCCASDERLRPY